MNRIHNTDYVDRGTPPDYWIRYALYCKMTPRERGRTDIFLCCACDRCRSKSGPCFSEHCSICGRKQRPVSLAEMLQ